MTTPTHMDHKFTFSEARSTLQALVDLEERMRTAISISSDDDEIADLSNDIISLRLLLKDFKESSLRVFGDSVLKFPEIGKA